VRGIFSGRQAGRQAREFLMREVIFISFFLICVNFSKWKEALLDRERDLQLEI
jgi:hypothetical protein